jgi:hypothetical protein
MAEINLTQEEANILIAMEKHRANEDRSDFPMYEQSLTLPLLSADKREQFLLDLSRARIDLQKVKMQNRGRQVVVLVRLDLGGAPHRNPFDEEIGVPHLHLYREGFGDKWAMRSLRNVPDRLGCLDDVRRLSPVLQYYPAALCVERGLFT